MTDQTKHPGGRPMPQAPWVIQRDDIPLITMGLETSLLSIASENTRKRIIQLLDEAEQAQKQ